MGGGFEGRYKVAAWMFEGSTWVSCKLLLHGLRKHRRLWTAKAIPNPKPDTHNEYLDAS